MKPNIDILEFSKISFSYNSKKMLLDNASFQVQKGEVVVILGHSGTGKSTLLKLSNRLIELQKGTLIYMGKSIQDYSPLRLRKELGFLPQTPYLIEGTVKDNLTLPLTLNNSSSYFQTELIETLISVGLDESYLTRPSQELSVGEKQRVALSRTLLNKSKLLLLDEPNSALDVTNSQILIDCLKSLVSQHGLTLMIVTHQIGFAEKIGDRFLLLESGKIKEINDPKNAFTEDIG